MMTDSGATALMFAAQFGQLKMVRYLIHEGADIDHIDQNGRTPLILASSNGHTDVVKCLMQKGANIHHKDDNHKNASFYATNYGHFDTARYIARNCSDILKNNPTEAVLFCALIYALKKVIEHLLTQY
ncbi:ankyrin repeat domain-containing protein 29-like [Sitodiplosis mosellana]|uniref:ankyrin repeat domain-containing protein 29-like n=1 Tax=Sitodiplosis mosellana TaxID=263140 RepID=UPI00244511F3|nr:ankyrin repeat domain-containing protein 29-like [Sitodiplosis mosellana]